VPDPATGQLEKNYRKMVAAAKDGAEAVRNAMEEISPGSDWIGAARDLIRARQATIPRFQYDHPDGQTLPWSPEEGVLRKILNAPLLKERKDTADEMAQDEPKPTDPSTHE
jgi:hypothetical protein